MLCLILLHLISSREQVRKLELAFRIGHGCLGAICARDAHRNPGCRRVITVQHLSLQIGLEIAKTISGSGVLVPLQKSRLLRIQARRLDQRECKRNNFIGKPAELRIVLEVRWTCHAKAMFLLIGQEMPE